MPTSSTESELVRIGCSECQHQQRHRWAQGNRNLPEYDGLASDRDSYNYGEWKGLHATGTLTCS